MSAEPMSGLNPDEMDGDGAAFAKRRQLPRRKSQMASRGMEERYKKIPHVQVFVGFFCYLTQASQHFDAINRPVRYFLDAGANSWDVKQQESKGHESRHPDDLPEDLL